MPKFKPVIRKMEKRSDGTVRVKIRVTHADKVRYITTDYYVPEECFDMKDGENYSFQEKFKERDPGYRG